MTQKPYHRIRFFFAKRFGNLTWGLDSRVHTSLGVRRFCLIDGFICVIGFSRNAFLFQAGCSVEGGIRDLIFAQQQQQQTMLFCQIYKKEIKKRVKTINSIKQKTTQNIRAIHDLS